MHVLASLHLLLHLHLRHECEIGLRREKIIEQNDTDTTQIIAYAWSFIIYANAWYLVGKSSHQLLKESCNHPSFFT